MGTRRSRTSGDLEGCDSEIVQLEPVNVKVARWTWERRWLALAVIARPMSFKSVSRVYPTSIECC